jgi:integrase/recombinase XerC
LFRKVKEGNNLRDEAIVALMLHAGLRVSEVCNLKRDDIQISARKGKVNVWGKGNKYREIPLNVTARRIISVARRKSSRTALSK